MRFQYGTSSASYISIKAMGDFMHAFYIELTCISFLNHTVFELIEGLEVIYENT